MAVGLSLDGSEQEVVGLHRVGLRIAAVKRLNLLDFERTVVAKVCKLAMAKKLKMAAICCKLVEATILGLAGFEWAVVARFDELVIATILKMVVLEWAAAAILNKLELAVLKRAVAGRLGLVGFQLVVVVVQAEAVLEVEAGGVAPPHRRPHRKTSHRRLSRVHVAEGGECWSYVGLDGCGASVAAVRLACVWAKAGAWVHLGGRLGSGEHIACTRQHRQGRRGNGPTCLLSVARAPSRLLASSVAQLWLQRLCLQVSTGKR